MTTSRHRGHKHVPNSLTLLSLTAALTFVSACAPVFTAFMRPKEVSFKSSDLELGGVVWKPEGPGPFSAVLYNHGSERLPGSVAAVAIPFVREGYVFFVPYRRGQGGSPGPYIMDALNAAANPTVRSNLLVTLHEQQLGDQLAGLEYLKAQSFVDTQRIVVFGFSFGGIQTMLGAEQPGTGYRAAVNCAGAAQTWAGSRDLQVRLIRAAQQATVPIFFMQAENDYNLTPSRALSEEMRKLGKPHQIKIYPRFGQTNQDGHAFCVRGVDLWGPDVFAFLKEALK